MGVKFTKAPFNDNHCINQWPTWNARYLDIFKAIRMGNPTLNQIIKHAPYIGGRQITLIDVRMQYLEPGYWTSRPKWHHDTPTDPEAVHHIYVIGDTRPVFEISSNQAEVLPINHYATYGPNTLHRGSLATVEEYRLFVRIQETNQVELEEKNGLKTFYSRRYPKGCTPYEETEEIFYARLNEKITHG